MSPAPSPRTPAAKPTRGDDEDRPGGEPVAVISDGLWKRRFRGDAAVVGTTIRLDGEPYTVIGVAPPGFDELWRREVWTPLGRVADASSRSDSYLLVFGRLRPGATLASARRDLAELAIGALIAWAASGVLRALLYEVSASDVAVLASSALGLAAVTLAGYLVPATRAARVEPVIALRTE
jgi:hypothetical protein